LNVHDAPLGQRRRREYADEACGVGIVQTSNRLSVDWRVVTCLCTRFEILCALCGRSRGMVNIRRANVRWTCLRTCCCLRVLLSNAGPHRWTISWQCSIVTFAASPRTIR
jgi:hypothetical protein